MFSIITPKSDLKIVKRVYDESDIFVRYVIQRKFLGRFHWIDASQRKGFILDKLEFHTLKQAKEFINSYSNFMYAHYEEPIGSDVSNAICAGIVTLSSDYPEDFEKRFTERELNICMEQTRHLTDRSVESILHTAFRTIEKHG